MSEQRSIALVTFGDPWLLPPTLRAAELLARRGFSVDVLGIRWRGLPRLDDADPPGVRTHILGVVGRGARGTLAWGRFAMLCCAHALRRRYRWVYAYDMMAAPVGRAMARLAGARFAYHCHDLSSDGELTRAQRLLGMRRAELRSARAADLVVLPQQERARVFAQEARLAAPPIVAWNCPLLSWPDGGGPIDPRIAQRKARGARLVLYQGGLGADLGLDALVDSLPHWPRDAELVVVGLSDPAGRGMRLRERAAQLGCEGRALFLAPLPYRALPSVGMGCDAGVLVSSAASSESVNLRHLAGASNKIFEYIACGLRVLAPNTEGFRELIEARGHGLLCRDSSPRALAARVAELLSPRHDGMGERNRAAFRRELNYERQFAPVVERLER